MSQTPPTVQTHYTVTYTYNPAHGLAGWLIGLLWAAIPLSAAAGVAAIWVSEKYPQVTQLQPGIEPPMHLIGPIVAMGCSGLCSGAVWLAAYVLLLIWVHRAASNARALGAQRMRFSPGASVCWMLPVVNLVMSIFVVSDLLRASRPGRGPTDWQDEPTPPLAWAWFGSLLGYVLLGIVVGVTTHPKLLNMRAGFVPLSAANLALSLAWQVLTLIIVHRVQRMQTQKAQALMPAYGAVREPWEM